MIEYAAIFTKEKVGGFSVIFPDLVGCITEGDTFDEAMSNAKEALTGYLESIDSRKMKIPKAVRHTGKNVRYVSPEKSVGFALWLKAKREEAQFTQKEIAAKIGIAYQTYQKFEDPGKSNPTLKTISRLEKVFGTQLIRV